jgi:Peptidase M50B-like
VSIAQPTLPGATAALIGVAALGLVAFDAGWQVVRHFTVMAHEGAHALIGLLLFRNIGGIVLHRGATGATNVGSVGGPSGFLIGLSGYLGPSAFGLGAAKLIQLRLSEVTLWGLLFLLALLLIALRWSFGIISVLVAGGIVFVIWRFAPMTVQVVASYSITWLLLLSGVRRVIEVGASSDDGAALRGITHLPGGVWFALWLAATLAAVVAGGLMLVPGL